MGRWRSGQTHLTVNQAALCLRGFESLPAHLKKHRQKKALIVIDLEKGFLTRYTKDLPQKIRNFIEKNDEYVVTLFTQYRNHPKSNFVRQLGYKGFIHKNQYEIVNELRDLVTKNNLFVKDTYGSFVNTKLSDTLRRN